MKNDIRRGKPSFYKTNKISENLRIYKALRESSPLTRRELSQITGMEIPTLCRALYNLVYKNRTIIISKYDLCKSTGKRVMYFGINPLARTKS